jgi:hypothetical protein
LTLQSGPAHTWLVSHSVEPENKEEYMKKFMCVFLSCAFLFSTLAFAQYTTNQQDTMAKSDTSVKSVMGKISDDGKTFTSDKDNKTWTIQNPDAVKGHEGHHVVLKAHVYPDKNEVHVMSLKMAKDNMKSDSMQH